MRCARCMVGVILVCSACAYHAHAAQVVRRSIPTVRTQPNVSVDVPVGLTSSLAALREKLSGTELSDTRQRAAIEAWINAQPEVQAARAASGDIAAALAQSALPPALDGMPEALIARVKAVTGKFSTGALALTVEDAQALPGLALESDDQTGAIIRQLYRREYGSGVLHDVGAYLDAETDAVFAMTVAALALPARKGAALLPAQQRMAEKLRADDETTARVSAYFLWSGLGMLLQRAPDGPFAEDGSLSELFANRVRERVFAASKSMPESVFQQLSFLGDEDSVAALRNIAPAFFELLRRKSQEIVLSDGPSDQEVLEESTRPDLGLVVPTVASAASKVDDKSEVTILVSSDSRLWKNMQRAVSWMTRVAALASSALPTTWGTQDQQVFLDDLCLFFHALAQVTVLDDAFVVREDNVSEEVERMANAVARLLNGAQLVEFGNSATLAGYRGSSEPGSHSTLLLSPIFFAYGGPEQWAATLVHEFAHAFLDRIGPVLMRQPFLDGPALIPSPDYPYQALVTVSGIGLFVEGMAVATEETFLAVSQSGARSLDGVSQQVGDRSGLVDVFREGSMIEDILLAGVASYGGCGDFTDQFHPYGSCRRYVAYFDGGVRPEQAFYPRAIRNTFAHVQILLEENLDRYGRLHHPLKIPNITHRYRGLMVDSGSDLGNWAAPQQLESWRYASKRSSLPALDPCTPFALFGLYEETIGGVNIGFIDVLPYFPIAHYYGFRSDEHGEERFAPNVVVSVPPEGTMTQPFSVNVEYDRAFAEHERELAGCQSSPPK